jgi:hypothetical protein
MGFTHSQLLQDLLDLYENPRYLEVGVHNAQTFRVIRAGEKVGVDPRFHFDLREDWVADTAISLYEMTSDEYFGSVAEQGAYFDVVFLDGLHSFEQTLRDLNSAISLLSPFGVVVIDDIQPTSGFAAMPNRMEFKRLRAALDLESGAWMGDVYKLVFFIETFYQQLSFSTVAENPGQLVVWRERRTEVPSRSVEAIARMGYEKMLLMRENVIVSPYKEILDTIRDTLGAASAAERR